MNALENENPSLRDLEAWSRLLLGGFCWGFHIVSYQGHQYRFRPKHIPDPCRLSSLQLIQKTADVVNSFYFSDSRDFQMKLLTSLDRLDASFVILSKKVESRYYSGILGTARKILSYIGFYDFKKSQHALNIKTVCDSILLLRKKINPEVVTQCQRNISKDLLENASEELLDSISEELLEALPEENREEINGEKRFQLHGSRNPPTIKVAFLSKEAMQRKRELWEYVTKLGNQLSNFSYEQEKQLVAFYQKLKKYFREKEKTIDTPIDKEFFKNKSNREVSLAAYLITIHKMYTVDVQKVVEVPTFMMQLLDSIEKSN